MASVNASLYYEAHVTIDPVFGEQRENAMLIAERHGFRLAELIMRKNLDDDAHMAKDDTFMTGRSRDLAYLTVNLQRLVKDMQDEGYSVRRYKIEDCIVDSQLMDDFRFLGRDDFRLLGRYARGGA